MARRRRILIIDDDAVFRHLAAKALSEEGFEVSEADDGPSGLEAIAACPPDLVVLDVVMPGMGGLQVCRALKSDPRTAGIPVIVLTGNDREGQEIIFLDLGADDYHTKPVDFPLLGARVRAALRRRPFNEGPRPCRSVGALRLDYESKTVGFGGRALGHLTPKEFDVLYELARVTPRAVSPAELYRRLWGAAPPSEASLKTVKVHVQRVRLKLGPPLDGWISHVSGRGYRLKAPAPTAAKRAGKRRP